MLGNLETDLNRIDGLALGAAFLAGVVVTGLWYEHRASNEVPETHAVTVAAIEHAARVDTVRIEKIAERTRAVEVVKLTRDTLLLHLTDTVAVKAFVLRVDTLLAKVAVSDAADSASRAADRAVIARQQDEIRAALNRPAPRMAWTVEGLYDPIGARYSGATALAVRLIGPVSGIARLSVALNERPAILLGVRFTVR